MTNQGIMGIMRLLRGFFRARRKPACFILIFTISSMATYLTLNMTPNKLESKKHHPHVPKHRFDLDMGQRDSKWLNRKTKHFRKGSLDDTDMYNNTIINPHNFQYMINEKGLCVKHNVSLIILVHSAPSHREGRELIRETWASVKSYRKWMIQTVFLLGNPTDQALQDEIIEESTQYHDIIQEEFIDSYRNLTQKNIMGLKWVKNWCSHAKYVLKMDDDTFVDLFKLSVFLERIDRRPPKNLLYCSLVRKGKPVRRKSDKWFVPKEEYQETYYPPYCEGFAYVMSQDLIGRLYNQAIRTKYYWIDDVFVTGIVAKKLGIHHKMFENPYGYTIMHKAFTTSKIKEVTFLLAKYFRNTAIWKHIWQAVKKEATLNELMQ